MSIEVMKQALEALESYHGYMEPLTTVFGGPRVPAEQSTTGKVEKAITSLRQAIAEAEKRPFTYDQMKEHSEGMQRDYDLLLAEYNLLKKDQEYSKNILVKLREKYKKLNQAIAEAEKQDAVQPDSVCKEDDGCPTEKAAEPEWYHGIDEHGCNRFYHKDEVRPSEFNNPLYTHPQPQPQPEQEPVAWMRNDGTLRFADGKMFAVGQPFYTTPQQRAWVGLTDEEVKKIAYNTAERKVAKDIEAKLKEKNT